MRKLSGTEEKASMSRLDKCSVCKKGKTSLSTITILQKRVAIRQCSNSACKALRRV